jgi:hypothetical protein
MPLGPARRARSVLALALALAACAPRERPAAAPPPRPVAPEPPAFTVDELPGAPAALEAVAAGPDATRARAALAKLAAVHHAAALVSPDRATHDAAAARALRRLSALDRAFFRERGLEAALASALAGAGAVAEADALARHLACPARFAYAPASDGAPPAFAPLPHDHDARYWDLWDRLHPDPIDVARAKPPPPRRGKPAPPPAGGPADAEEETRYAPIYAECPADPADAEGADARARAWLAVAEGHLARDAAAGPFAVLRAIEAIERAVAAARPAPRGAAMRSARLALGDALARHERYRAATVELVGALGLCEDSGACAPAEREHALARLADAITHVDFDGPPADAPVVLRADVLDTEPDPAVAARKLRVGLERAEDGRVVPQDRAFVPALLAAIADLERALGFPDEALVTLERLRRRAPMHREAPRVVEAMARLEAEAARQRRVADAAPGFARAVARWDELAAMLAPGSAWREANAADVDALAEGARRARAVGPDRADVLVALAGAIDAAATRGGALPIDDAATSAALARARDAWAPLAVPGKAGVRARAGLATIAVAEVAFLARTAPDVDAGRWAEAWRAVEATRDDPDAREGRIAAARLLVTLADRHVAYEEGRFVASRGRLGLAPRARALRPPLASPAVEELPPAVADAVRARDALAEAAAADDARSERREALVAAAGLLFSYGHTVPASRRLASAAALACRDPGGFATWKLAALVARAGRDTGELARLAAEHADPATTCARTPGEQAEGRRLAGAPKR